MDSMMEGNGVILEEATVTGGDYCCDGLSWTCFVGCKVEREISRDCGMMYGLFWFLDVS